MNGPLTNQFLINRDSEGFGFVIGLRMNRENRHHFEVAPLSPNIGRQRKKKRRRRRASPTPPAGAGVSFPASGPSGSGATSIRPDYRGRDFLFRLLFFFRSRVQRTTTATTGAGSDGAGPGPRSDSDVAWAASWFFLTFRYQISSFEPSRIGLVWFS